MKRSDLSIAKAYLEKAQSSKDRELDFTLSFSQYKRLVTRKKCQITNILFNKSSQGYNPTLDRLDNSLGYIPGNVITVCHFVNQVKSIWENPNNPLTIELVKMVVDNTMLYLNNTK